MSLRFCWTFKLLWRIAPPIFNVELFFPQPGPTLFPFLSPRQSVEDIHCFMEVILHPSSRNLHPAPTPTLDNHSFLLEALPFSCYHISTTHSFFQKNYDVASKCYPRLDCFFFRLSFPVIFQTLALRHLPPSIPFLAT